MSTNDLQSLVDDLAGRLRRSVAIDDPSIRLLAASRHFGDEDSLRITSILNRSVPDDVTRPLFALGIGTWVKPGRAHLDVPGSKKRLCVPVRCKSLLLGFLWLIDNEENPLTESDVEMAEDTAARAGMILYARLLLRERSNLRREAILRNLVTSAEDARRQAVADVLAEQLLVEHASYYQVIAVQREIAHPVETSDDIAVEVAVQEGLHTLPDGAGLMVADRSRAWLLLALTEALTKQQLGSITQRMTSRFHQLSGNDSRFVVGVSDTVSALDQVYRAYRQAVIAVRAALLVPSLGNVAKWGRLGPYDTLLRLPNDEIASAAGSSPLQRLEAADRQQVLETTLRAFFDNACDIRRTANLLCIHRATLYQRLKRIEQLTDCNLDSGDDRLTLHLGLKMKALAAANTASTTSWPL
ncbi:PucR-like helix-turn-helix protein [Williamsia muralis]|uniref:PucR-like helix-turn-helix protein n=1 Tax=Williamsia marianensis TaxID=85044 RepID=A0A495K9X5_WILMA|nr:helix-turn-helix domain-containing protein [Williamsia muralis]RKR97438.1 PucR-like helix-turn-helix protein [Williamsia muralis]